MRGSRLWMVVGLLPVLSSCELTPGGSQRAPGGVEVRRVFGPEVQGKYKHPTSFTQLKSGGFYLVYHGGTSEYSDDTAVFGSRQAANSGNWSEPGVIADTPDRGEGNAVVWQAPDGLLWLFYVCRYGPTWASSRIKAKTSSDEGTTWSDSFLLSFEQGLMVRSRPIVVGEDYLLPVYHEAGDDPEKVSAECTSLFLRYSPKKKAWTASNRIRSRLGNLQPAVARVGPSRLVCYCRRGGDYEGQDDGFLVRSESLDGGYTWKDGEDSAFPNPNAAVDFIRLESGNLLLVYNDSFSERTPLSVAISTDNDESYSHRINIADGDNSYAYPTVLQAADGMIHIFFTSDERQVIRHAIFDEDAVLKAQRHGDS